MAIHTRCREIELVLRTPFRLSRGTSETRRNVIFEIEEDGVVGRGEAAPIPRYRESAESAAAALATMAAGLAEPRAFAEEAARPAVPGQRAAQAACDAALHDLAGRRLGLPVAELLGLGRRPLPPTSWTIGVDPIPEALGKVAAAGRFEVLKLKMGLPGDLELLRAVRGATQQAIRVDANEGWSFEEARARLPELARLGVEFVEQPMKESELDAIRELRRTSPLPFVADESLHDASDIPRIAAAFDGINVKLAKCGGIAPALALIATARAHGLKILLGCMIESSLGIAAALAVAPLVDWIDLDGSLLVGNDPFGGLTLDGGRFRQPEGPGLGVEPGAIGAA
jgi:L-alanine-DL-glutamate epimerase-like enolase superfamily enzyme